MTEKTEAARFDQADLLEDEALDARNARDFGAPACGCAPGAM